MGAKIYSDEITSMIKERIDNFELNVDLPTEKDKRGIAIVSGSGNILTEAVKEIIDEQIMFYSALNNPSKDISELIKAFEFQQPILKEEKSKDWYRKFEKKKRH